MLLRKLFGAIAAGVLSLATHAAEIMRLDVDRRGDAYYVHVEMEFDTPPEQVRAILTDYDNLDRLNPSVTASRIIGINRDGTLRVFTRFEHCVLLYCVDMQKVEDISEDEQGRIRLVMVPGASSFRSGVALWDIQRSSCGSRVILHARVEPDLRLPAWLGAGIVKSVLRRQIRASFDKLESLAHSNIRSQRTTAIESPAGGGRRDS